MTYITKSSLKEEVEKLAEQAFHHHLISGYGDGEYPGGYQIVYKGKPRHFSLEYARAFLESLMFLEGLTNQQN